MDLVLVDLSRTVLTAHLSFNFDLFQKMAAIRKNRPRPVSKTGRNRPSFTRLSHPMPMIARNNADPIQRVNMAGNTWKTIMPVPTKKNIQAREVKGSDWRIHPETSVL